MSVLAQKIKKQTLTQIDKQTLHEAHTAIKRVGAHSPCENGLASFDTGQAGEARGEGEGGVGRVEGVVAGSSCSSPLLWPSCMKREDT